VGTVWVTGENGAQLAFSEPLPPVIAAQVARGILRPAEPPADAVSRQVLERMVHPDWTDAPPPPPDSESEPQQAAEPAEADRPRMPSARSSAAAWRAYAVSQGMPKGRAAAMTKASLRTEFSRLRAVS
jgi:hypothetical protein